MSSKPIILALNRNPRNTEILIKILNQEGYSACGVNNPTELDNRIETIENISLVLMDISGFNGKVWKSCELLKISQIPFLVLSPHQHDVIEKQSRIYGASGVLLKPLAVKELLILIQRLLQN